VAMAEEDKKQTIFIADWGQFQFGRMPLGAMIAPLTFQTINGKDIQTVLINVLLNLL